MNPKLSKNRLHRVNVSCTSFEGLFNQNLDTIANFSLQNFFPELFCHSVKSFGNVLGPILCEIKRIITIFSFLKNLKLNSEPQTGGIFDDLCDTVNGYQNVRTYQFWSMSFFKVFRSSYFSL